jgi:hypothetical protein
LSFLATIVLFGSARANADVAQAIPEIGNLERWTAFSLGSTKSFSSVFGGAHVMGDFGQAGNGKLLMAGNALLDGDLYIRSNGAVLEFDHAVVTGSTFYNQDALLDDSVNEALAASELAFGLTPNRPDKSVNLKGDANITIAGAPGETVVLNLKSFILRGDSSFTLQGTATTTFIINVRKNFSLKGNAHVDLAGLQWNQVLFNVVGHGNKVFLGGNSDFGGILMANNRTIEVKRDATISGEIVGNRLKLYGSSRVVRPAIVSP